MHPQEPGPPPDARNDAVLETPRLRLDAPRRGDAEALFPLVAGEPGRAVTDTLCWDGPADLEAMEAWVERYARCTFADGGFHWILRDPTGAVSGSEGLALGSIGMRPHGPRGRVDLGYYLGRAWWGQGLMREAVIAVTRHAFDRHRVVKVEAEVFLENPRGLGLLEGLGFRREGTLRSAVRKRGRWLDVALFGLVEGELDA